MRLSDLEEALDRYNANEKTLDHLLERPGTPLEELNSLKQRVKINGASQMEAIWLKESYRPDLDIKEFSRNDSQLGVPYILSEIEEAIKCLPQ